MDEVSDIEFLRQQNRWPGWPVVGLVKRKPFGPPDCSVMTVDPLDPSGRLWCEALNVWDTEAMAKATWKPISWVEIENLLRDGWEVD